MQQKASSKTSDTLSILLVDDEAQERSGVRFLIEKLGLPLVAREAQNGKRAWEMLQSAPVDILFTDVKMPYMDGLELARQVNAAFPNTKIIVFSAYGEFEYAKRAMEANAVNYLLKPIDVAEFERVMVQVVGQCREDAARERQRTEQLLADKKLMFVSMLSGKIPVSAAIIQKLSALGFADSEMQYRLIHVQTGTDYFSHYESGFLTLLDTYAPCAAEYINLYPNSAYVLLYGKAIPDDAALTVFCEKLSADIEKLHGASGSFLIGMETDGLVRLPGAAASMDTLRDRMLGWEAPVILESELLLPELGRCTTM